MSHGGAARGHTILQIVGDDRGDVVRSDGNVLNKRRGVAQVIICDPGADDGAPGAELCVIGLRQCDRQVSIVIVTVVRRFHISRWRNICDTGNGDIVRKR